MASAWKVDPCELRISDSLASFRGGLILASPRGDAMPGRESMGFLPSRQERSGVGLRSGSSEPTPTSCVVASRHHNALWPMGLRRLNHGVGRLDQTDTTAKGTRYAARQLQDARILWHLQCAFAAQARVR